MKHQPWQYSTGPRTPAGKARSAANADRRTMDEGYAELQRIQREALATIDDAQKIRARLEASSRRRWHE